MGVIRNYEDAVRELYYWQHNRQSGDDFNSLIFHLIQKAQSTPENMAKLRAGFSNEIEALNAWNKAGNYGDDLFVKHGLIKKKEEGV